MAAPRLTFHLPGNDLDAVLREVEGVLLRDPLLERPHDHLPLLLVQEPHARGAQHQEGGLMELGGGQMGLGEIQQGAEGFEGLLRNSSET